jgi:hypothetical protein
MNTVTKDDLIRIGYTTGTAQSIIRQAKYKMVSKGFTFYSNKRLGRVPVEVVEEIIGTKIIVGASYG